MPKIQKIETKPGEPETFVFDCPACECKHWFSIPPWHWIDDKGKKTDTYDLDRPSVRNSILVHNEFNCHSFITDGRIKYEKDSKHSLAGLEVELPDFKW